MTNAADDEVEPLGAAEFSEDGMSPEEIRALKRQIVATFLDIPCRCITTRCRRRGRCVVAGAPCLHHHRGFAECQLVRLLWAHPVRY